MNDRKIYARTSHGGASLEGVRPGVAGLSGDEMRVMKLVDGIASVAEIEKMLPPSVRAHMSEIFSRLLASRLIAENGSATMGMHIKVPARVSREDVQITLMSSQKLNKDMLVLAEIEIERRMELEEDFAVAKAELTSARTMLGDVKAQLDAESSKYQMLKQKVLAYKQGMEGRIATLQSHIEKILGSRQAAQAERAQVAEDLELMRNRFAQMEAAVEENEATLDDTLRQRVLQEQRAEEEQRKLMKIQADEMVRTHPHYNLLRKLDFFKDFRNSDIAQFLIYAQWREAKAGEAVVAEGEDDCMFYVIVSGKMMVLKAGRTLHVFHAGEPFGEISYMDDQNTQRSASVVARTDCLLLVFDPAYLDDAEMIFRMRVAEAFVRIQARRLRRAVEVVNNLLVEDKRKA